MLTHLLCEPNEVIQDLTANFGGRYECSSITEHKRRVQHRNMPAGDARGPLNAVGLSRND